MDRLLARQRDGILQPAPELSGLLLELAAVEGVLDAIASSLSPERLQQVVVSAEHQRLLDDGGVVEAAHHRERDVGSELGDLLRELEAGFGSEVEVAEAERDRPAAQRVARLGGR